jgi:hypothetical protein
LYWHLVITGVTPRFLGGYAPFAASVGSIGLLIAGAARRTAVNWIDVAVVGFLALVLLTSYLNGAHGAPPAIVESYLSMTIQWTALFLLFRSFPIDAGSVVLLRVSLLVMLVFVANYGITGAFLLAGPAGSVNGVPTYQDFGVYLSIVALAVLSLERGFALRTLVTLLSLGGLLLLGSRSELVLFLIVAGVIWLSEGKLLQGLAVAGVVAVLVYLGTLYLTDLEASRVVYWVSILLEGGGIDSDPLRKAFNEQGVATISQHPVLGSFAYYPPGEYAHNVLSLWADFGVGIFALYVVMFVGILVAVLRAHGARAALPLPFALFFGVWLGTAVLLIAAKNFGYFVVPMLLGAASQVLHARQRHRRAPVRQGEGVTRADPVDRRGTAACATQACAATTVSDPDTMNRWG